MKLSSSTSAALIATLAISSSSTCLAAPASDTPSSEGGMTSSSSSHNIATPRDASAGRAVRPPNMQRSINMARSTVNDDLEARGGLLDGILSKILGPFVCGPTSEKSAKQAMFEAQSDESIPRKELVQRLQAALNSLQQESSYAPDASSSSDDSSYRPSDVHPDDRDDVNPDGDGSSDPNSSVDDHDDQDDDSSWYAAEADHDPTPSSSALFSSSAPTSSPAPASSSASAASSFPENPPNSPAMSSTTSSIQPTETDTPARRDKLVGIAVSLVTGVVAVAADAVNGTPVVGAVTVPGNAGAVPSQIPAVANHGGALPVPAITSNAGAGKRDNAEDDASRLAYDIAQVARRWGSRSVQPSVQAPAAGATSTAMSVPAAVAGKVPPPVDAATGSAPKAEAKSAPPASVIDGVPATVEDAPAQATDKAPPPAASVVSKAGGVAKTGESAAPAMNL